VGVDPADRSADRSVEGRLAIDPVLSETAERIAALGAADIVVSLAGGFTGADVRTAVAVLRQVAPRLQPDLRMVAVCPVEAGEGDWPTGEDLQLLPYPLPSVSLLPFSSSDVRSLFAPLAQICARVSARAVVVIGTRADGLAVDTVEALLRPLLTMGADLVLPHYPRHRLDGLINSAVVYPLTRALYGRQVDGQLGVDFGFSPRMLERLASIGSARVERPIWLLTEAVTQALQVAEARVAAWDPPGENPTDLSTALTQVLGPLFVDTDAHAVVWQKIRGSQPVSGAGHVRVIEEEHRTVDARSMVESFRLGSQSLHEIWSRVMPPATLVEVRRLTSAPLERFRLPDALWARIVFDFALGHRLRVMNRDHLLRAMTPLYLAWVASFVLEVGEAHRATVDARIERQCAAYEAEKPYLVARWRWPDRFNP
jgi:hypothetical protein